MTDGRRGADLRVGLTGGIASGKSTVAHAFEDHGALVIDADRIAHEAIAADGPAYAEVVAAFGTSIVRVDGSIDRERLGAVVFEDPEARRRLERIVHPRVRQGVAARMRTHDRWPAGPRVAVVDAALLVETGSYREYDRIVVVRCPPATQVRRLEERDGLSAEQARARIAAQAPLEDKVAVADYVVDTDVPLAVTLERVEEVWRLLLDDARARIEGRALAERRQAS
jgi:dephospho-CoA kinase